MKRFANSIFLLCGLVLTLAAVPVCGQKNDGGIEINKKPLRDFAAFVTEKVDKKEVDLEKPFLVELDGLLTKNGRFDPKQSKFTRSEGDRQMIEVAEKAILAVGDSGGLGYLSAQGVTKIKLIAAQNSETSSVSIISEQPSAEKAKTLSSGFNSIVQAALLLDKNGSKKLGETERTLLGHTRVTAEGKNVIINVSLPVSDFREIVRRELNR